MSDEPTLGDASQDTIDRTPEVPTDDTLENTPDDIGLGVPTGTILEFLYNLVGTTLNLAFVVFWYVKNRIYIHIRSHLTFFLAILLVILGFFREYYDKFENSTQLIITPWIVGENYSFKTTYWHLFIYGVYCLTILAAAWEIFGNKLATTPQERRFIAGMDRLVVAFDIFRQDLSATQTKGDAEGVLLNFEKKLLRTTAWILCGKHSINSALMRYDDKREGLVLNKSIHMFIEKDSGNDRADTSNLELFIDLNEEDKNKIGPAATAFKEKQCIVHLPYKFVKIGFIFSRNAKGEFKFKTYFKGWYPGKHKYFEDFRSVLSISISDTLQPETDKPFGVLNFTTKRRDLFTPRDYSMTVTFSRLLAQAIRETNLQINRIEGKS